MKSTTTTGQTKQLAFRLPHELVTWLESEAERVSRETDLAVSVSDVARRILTRAMRDATAATMSAMEPPKVTRKEPTGESRVHAALLAALAKGRQQAEIARAAGVDGGQVSRFKKTKKGLSPERLAALAKELGA